MKTSKQIEKLAQQYADNYNLDKAQVSYIAFIDGYETAEESTFKATYWILTLGIFIGVLIGLLF